MAPTPAPATTRGDSSVLDEGTELVALGTDSDAALAAAEATGGVAYVLHGDTDDRLAFSTVVRSPTADVAGLAPAATVGLYVSRSRVICRRDRPARAGNPSPGFTAVFGLVRNPDLTRQEADDHWRDVHAPLALEHHAAMWDYTQLSLVAAVDGDESALPIDGLALCAFRTLDDLHTRFFNDDESRRVIVADVSKFADPSASPRRLIATEHPF